MFNNNYQRQMTNNHVPLNTAKNGAKIDDLMCNITCRNKAQHRQRRFFFLQQRHAHYTVFQLFLNLIMN